MNVLTCDIVFIKLSRDRFTAQTYKPVTEFTNTIRRCVKLLHELTSWLINVHENHVIIGCQDRVELLVAHRRQLGHVPCVTLVH